MGTIAAMKSSIMSGTLALTLLLGALSIVYGGSATWNLHPTSGDWNTAINWTPATVPNGPGSSATFDVSNTTSVGISADINIGSIVFNLGASAYTITAGSADSDTSLTISGAGVVNNSGVVQNFILAGGPASANTMFFTGAAAAGVMTVYTCAAGAGSGNTYLKFRNSSSADHATVITDGATGQGLFLAGWVFFEKNATASDATIINNPGVFAGGKTFFYDRATAANATVICNGATASTNRGGSVEMNQNATGGDATFIVNGSDTALQGGGTLYFINASTGGDATVIVNGGLKDGGHLVLSTVDTDSRARCEIFGNGELDLELVDGQIGSLEGDGLVFLGPLNLTVGGNSLETTFSGVIADGGPIGGVGGSLTIANDGSLELTNANTYTGLTAVSGGTLIASNTTGSATGTGPVTVYAGTLSGNGIIGGAVTLGDGAGRSVLLAPSYKTTKYVTLTIQGYLTFNPHAIYNYTFRAKRSRAKTDKVVANGVTINSNASFNLSGQTQGALTQGLVLTVIDNTALTPIAGTFSNLPDGGIVNVNGNNLQASYEGGDGNDLTLTVVP